MGDVDLAFSELQRAIDEVEERSACARRLVSLAAKTGSDGRTTAALDRLLKLGCETPGECVTNFTFAAGVETSRGANRRALTFIKKASELLPERDDLLLELAARAESERVYGESLEAYTKLMTRHPEEPKWAEAVTRVRSEASRGAFERR
jgi:hypothetical protein